MGPVFSKFMDFTRRRLSAGRLPVVVALVAVLLTLTSFNRGFMMDDYFHRQILMYRWAWPVHDASICGMFSFLDGDPDRSHSMMDVGALPWWTYDRGRGSFWRPLAELTHMGDYALWPWSADLMHGQSLLWFGAVVWAVAVLYRRLGGAAWVAGLAALLFAVDDSHAVTVTWIANRHALISTFFSVLALIAYDRRRRDGWRPGAFLAPVFLLMGLLAGETALAVAAYLIPYALFLDRGSLRLRALSLLPCVLVLVGWGVVYRVLGFGSYGMGAYIDPGREPLAFLGAVFERAPVFLLALLAQPPADLYGGDYYRFMPHGSLVVWLAAAAFVTVAAMLLWPLLRRSVEARFWGAGMLLSLLPACATFPHNRMLLVPGIGAMGLVAIFLAGRLEPGPSAPERPLYRRAAAGLAGLFVVIHLAVAPILLPLNVVALDHINNNYIKKPALTIPWVPRMPERTYVLINPPVAALSEDYTPVRDAYGKDLPGRLYALASGTLPLTITRVDARSIDVSCEEGLIETTFDRIFRGSSRPMRVGDRVCLTGMTVEVMALAGGWQPSRARFTFPVPLEDPSLLILYWKHGAFRLYPLPATGQSASIPAERLH